MARAKGITSRTVTGPTKVPPVWQIGIMFPDGRKIVKHKCTLNDLFDTYFINLDSLKGNLTPEELLEKYKSAYKSKGIKVVIFYIDSWNHRWSGKVAWPKKEWFIEYLNKRIQNNEKNID